MLGIVRDQGLVFFYLLLCRDFNDLNAMWKLQEKENYPPYMSYTISTTSAENYTGSYWSDWKNVETPNCSFAPTSSLKSMVSADGKQENVSWDIYYQYD